MRIYLFHFIIQSIQVLCKRFLETNMDIPQISTIFNFQRFIISRKHTTTKRSKHANHRTSIRNYLANPTTLPAHLLYIWLINQKLPFTCKITPGLDMKSQQWNKVFVECRTTRSEKNFSTFISYLPIPKPGHTSTNRSYPLHIR